MTTEITDAEYLQLVGLLTLAKVHNERLKDIVTAAHSLLKVKPDNAEVSGIGCSGHIDDAIYSDYSADELIKKLGVERA